MLVLGGEIIAPQVDCFLFFSCLKSDVKYMVLSSLQIQIGGSPTKTRELHVLGEKNELSIQHRNAERRSHDQRNGIPDQD